MPIENDKENEKKTFLALLGIFLRIPIFVFSVTM